MGLELIQPGKSSPSQFTPADVEKALRVLVLEGGNSKRTAERLKELGLTVSDSTLRDWRTGAHRERYLDIAAELQPEVERSVVASTLDYLQQSEAVKAGLLEELQKQVDSGNVKDPAKSIQNLAVSQGIGMDTVLKVQGRPTQLIQHSSVDESVDTLKRLGIVVEGTAEEISDAEVEEAEPAAGGVGSAIAPGGDKQTPAPAKQGPSPAA